MADRAMPQITGSTDPSTQLLPSKESPIRKRHVRKEPKNDDDNNNTKSSSSVVSGRDIRKGIQEQHRNEAVQHRRIARIQQQSHAAQQKYYFAIIINLLLVFMGGVVYLKPELLVQRPHARTEWWPPRQLALLYPPQVSPLRDLPKWFQSYSIATDENYDARQAWRYLLATRQKLKPYSILVTAWERAELMQYSTMDSHCGKGFTQLYKTAVAQQNLRYSEDLILWCLLRTYQNDGYLQWNLALHGGPTSSVISQIHDNQTRVKGLAVQHALHHRIHPSIFWIPKKKELIIDNNTTDEAASTTTTRTRYDMDTEIPNKMLAWLMQKASRMSALEYPQRSQEHLYQLLQAEPDQWLFLTTICDHDTGVAADEQRQQLDRTLRVIARDCSSNNHSNNKESESSSCCTIYMPQELEDYRYRRQPSRRRNDDSDEDGNN